MQLGIIRTADLDGVYENGFSTGEVVEVLPGSKPGLCLIKSKDGRFAEAEIPVEGVIVVVDPVAYLRLAHRNMDNCQQSVTTVANRLRLLNKDLDDSRTMYESAKRALVIHTLAEK